MPNTITRDVTDATICCLTVMKTKCSYIHTAGSSYRCRNKRPPRLFSFVPNVYFCLPSLTFVYLFGGRKSRWNPVALKSNKYGL